MPEFKDQQIACGECGISFTWDAKEQEYFHKKGFTNPPKLCRACRAKRKIHQEEEKSREKEITCSVCGKNATTGATLPEYEKILCLDCFLKRDGEYFRE